jgi:hypothetical protein
LARLLARFDGKASFAGLPITSFLAINQKW